MSDELNSSIPTLAEQHSGIPTDLLEKATKAKALIYEGKTRPTNTPSTRQVVLPEGISTERFSEAVEKLRSLLGEENVEVNDKPLKDGWYMEHSNTHDMMSVLNEEALVASAVVYPGSTEEVSKVVIWANEYLIPIFPISMGRNLGYGGAAPRVSGSVVIDLGRRMHRILDINSEDYTCLVEPGVSYYALYEAIQTKGYTHLWIDTPDLGGGSVIGNALDRGVGYTPYGDHWACHSGLEVVLPTGEIVRTGMGALPGNNTWQTFPYGFGPYSDGIFSQSNFGIVTKMGMTLMPNPGGYESFMYTFQKEEDLGPLMEIIRPLRIGNILENVAQVRHVIQTLAVRGKPRTTYFQGEGPIPEDIVREQVKRLPIGDHTWVYYGMSYGPEFIRKYKLDIIDKEFRKIPGARRVDTSILPNDEYFWSRDRIAAGVPDFVELLWVNWMPNGAHIAFSPVSPIRGTDALKLFEIGKRRHDEAGIDFLPAFCVGLREMHLIVEIVFDKHDPKMRKAADRCLREMIDDAAKEGYGEYRTHLVLMDQIAATYNWNNNALMRFHERLKDCLDPNGIMAPRKSGIWPAQYRGRGWEMDEVNSRDGGAESAGAGAMCTKSLANAGGGSVSPRAETQV